MVRLLHSPAIDASDSSSAIPSIAKYLKIFPVKFKVQFLVSFFIKYSQILFICNNYILFSFQWHGTGHTSLGRGGWVVPNLISMSEGTCNESAIIASNRDITGRAKIHLLSRKRARPPERGR